MTSSSGEQPGMVDGVDSEGIRRKFNVSRVDPEAQQRHPDCFHFVLDVDHDPAAGHALLAYADACDGEHPQLAADLRRIVMTGVRP